jgi:hypothetical protein
MNDVTNIYTYEEKNYVGDDLKVAGDAANKATSNFSQVDEAINGLLNAPYVKISDDIIVESACEGETKNALPIDGTLTFTGYPDEIIRTLRTLLDGRKIEMTVDWTVIDI